MTDLDGGIASKPSPAPPGAVVRTAHPSEWRLACAELEKQAQNGDYEFALETAEDTDWVALAEHEPDAAVRARGWMTLARVSVASGVLAQAVSSASRAHAAAAEAADTDLQRRATALIALGLAANGEHEAARAHLRTDDSDSPEDPWAVVARLLLAARAIDVEAFDAADAELRALVFPRREVGEVVRTVVSAAHLMLHGHVDEAVAATLRITHGARRLQLPPILRAVAVTLRAHALLARGEALRALSSLREARSPSGHAVCFPAVRARLHLALDHPRDALRATDACLRMGESHALGSLVTVYLTRAVALERLAHTDAADAMFGDGLHLALASGSLSTLALLPEAVVDALWERSSATTDAARQQLDEARRLTRTLRPADARRPRVPDFSPREAVVAEALIRGVPLNGIAEELHISPNTVKSQTRAVYRKAGVSSRAELIGLLDEAGFDGNL